MNRILCSTGAIIGRPNGRNHRLLASFAPELHCDGFEFMIYDTWYDKLDEVVSDTAALGLSMPTVHCEKTVGERFTLGDFSEGYRLFEINCRAAERLGAGLIVLHLWNGIVSDSHFENNLSAVPEIIRIASAHGLIPTVENVVCNRGDPQKRLDELAERTDIRFTFDTKMAAFHGQLMDIFAPEREFFWRDGRIAHIHANDYGGGYMDWQHLKVLHLGEGNVPLKEFFGKLEGRGYCGDFTVESTGFGADGKVDFDALNRDFNYLRQFFG